MRCPAKRRARATERTAKIRERRVAEVMAELRRAQTGRLLRLQRVCNVWYQVLPEGPRMSLVTMRMLEREGLARQLEGGGKVPGRETWAVDL